MYSAIECDFWSDLQLCDADQEWIHGQAESEAEAEAEAEYEALLRSEAKWEYFHMIDDGFNA
jgi:hypothetical protein